MSNLFKKIQDDLKTALKEKNAEKISTLRMLISDIKNEEIAKKKKGKLEDAEIQAVVSRAVRRHKDSIESYRAGSREDLAKKEEGELQILQNYLPKQISQEELEKIINEAISNLGASSPLDFGKVMGAVMKQVKGKADGKLVGEMVKAKLNIKH
ncbi:MAG: GatB/YqeY domain-containing protein [Patescibacteria group bacterium]